MMSNTATALATSLQQIDKSDWPTYKFEDIAFNISERVEPQATNLDIYVGLEHLDSGDIHIRRKGTPADVKGTKLKVYKGDIIFGKRRAYQRKAAIADFDGICSAHAMVIRANSETIDPQFLPFFLHSDAFMNRAVEISEGSLSPTIKWKILKEQEFKLPPLHLQEIFSEVFRSTDEVIEKKKNLLVKYLQLKSSYIKNAVFDVDHYKMVHLSDVAKFMNGFAFKPTDWGDSGYPIIRIQNLTDPSKPFNRTNRVVPEKYNISKGDILASWSAVLDVFEWDSEPALLNQHIFKVNHDEKIILKPFFKYVLKASIEQMLKYAHGTTMKHVVKKDFLDHKIPLPTLEEQNEIIEILENIDQSVHAIRRNIDSSDKLISAFIKQIVI